jgi:hypothetical protein
MGKTYQNNNNVKRNNTHNPVINKSKPSNINNHTNSKSPSKPTIQFSKTPSNSNQHIVNTKNKIKTIKNNSFNTSSHHSTNKNNNNLSYNNHNNNID